MKDLGFADYAVVAAFFAVMIGVGVYFSRRSKSSEQFFGGDKSVPWWLSGVSFYMNSFSALAFVMYSALAYKFGWVPVTVSWLSVPAVLFGAWFLAVRWRRAAKGSPIDYIATRYTPRMCSTLALLGLPMQLLDNALKLLAIGTVVGVGMGFPLFWAICISGVIIVLYTFLGGLKATLTCDFIQFIVILVVVFALPPLCLGRMAAMDGGSGMVHGFQVFLDKVPDGFFNFTAGKYGWIYMLVFLCAVGSTLSTNWSLVQRYYSTKSEKDAKKMAYLVAALLFLGPPLFFFPAMAARVFMPELDVNDSNAMNAVYATLCKTVLPTGMIGMVIAAMFSATMSSLAGNFNAAAAVMVNEIYLRMDRAATAARRMVAARIATVLVGLGVVGLTFVMQYAQGAKDLFDVTNKMFGVFLPPIAIPMLAGVFVRWLSRRAGMVALVGGMAVGVAIFLVGGAYPFLREFEWIFSLTAAATIVFIVLGTFIFPDRPEERAEVEAFFRQITTPAK
ncbi:MAG: hypothetical protein IKO72_16180 [Kiritimatiellae bacterium]|nr:hypothetical protein [Kiritimatiellia bacterium]